LLVLEFEIIVTYGFSPKNGNGFLRNSLISSVQVPEFD